MFNLAHFIYYKLSTYILNTTSNATSRAIRMMTRIPRRTINTVLATTYLLIALSQ